MPTVGGGIIVGTGGGSGGSGSGGATTNPVTGLPVTESPVMLDMRVRTACCAVWKQIETTLYYWRDAAWNVMPVQPLTTQTNHPVHKQACRQPATLAFTMPDTFGNLTPENLESPFNYDTAGNYDPLMDEARKIQLRIGVFCWENIGAGVVPTASAAPVSGSLAELTDGTFNVWSGGTLTTGAAWTGSSDIVFDFGAEFAVQNIALRFGTKVGTWALPDSVEFAMSQDGSDWTVWPARPVGGPSGDWDEDYDGRAVEIAKCDLDTWAQYVRLRVTASEGQTWAIDEIALYGSVGNVVTGNVFTGYLGDTLDFDNAGVVNVTATDALKKLADNNEIRLTPAYQLTELGDIAHSLFTSTGFWKGQSDYNKPFADAEIGWAAGSGLTTLIFPLWQGQTNSMLGYAQELFNAVGWAFAPDGSGVLQAYEPVYKQVYPDRLCIAAPDGNNDARRCVRHRSGKDLRNTVEVTTGKTNAGGAGSDTQFEPNSVARYGPRRNVVTDPLANTAQLRQQTARYILRDYAWRVQTLTSEIAPSFETRLRDIFAFRAPARPNLYAKASAADGGRRKQELWGLMALEQHFTPSDWWGLADWIPYFPLPSDPPQLVSLTPRIGLPAVMDGVFNAITDPQVSIVRVYVSSTSSNSGFTLNSSVGPGAVSFPIFGLTPGQQYWVYVTTVNTRGVESLPSNVLTTIAGGSPDEASGWTVLDLGASVTTRSGPDSQGYYTYTFDFTWTSPSAGFKRMQIMGNPLREPTSAGDPNAENWSSWAWGNGGWEWHGDFIAPGLGWDRATPQELTWTIKFRTKYVFAAGERCYWRMWTSSATGRWRRWGGDSDPGWPSNVVYVTF